MTPAKPFALKRSKVGPHRSWNGPAMRMIRELYKQTWWPKDDTKADGFIAEPKGWKPIFTKMSAM